MRSSVGTISRPHRSNHSVTDDDAAMITSPGVPATEPNAAPRRGASVVEPQVGWVLPVVAASVAFAPFVTPAGPANISPADIVIAAALALGGAWAASARPALRLPYVVSMALYMGGGALSALLGPIPGAGLLALVQDGVLLAWALVIVNVIRGPNALGVVLRTWVWAGVAWAAIMISGYLLGIGALSGVNPEFGGRAALRFADPNMAGTYFVTTILLVWATATPRKRWQRLGVYVILLWALVLTGSNGGFAALAVGIGMAALLRLALRRGLVSALAVGCAGLVAVLTFVLATDFDDIQEMAGGAGRTGELTLGRSDTSMAGRADLKRFGWALYGDGSVLGDGPESAEWRLQQAQAPVATELHDDYLAALVERGLIGAAGLVLLVGSLTMRTRTLVRGGRVAGDGISAVLPNPWALAGALSALAVSALFYQVLHFRHVWALFAVVAAVQLWRDQ